jgi:hypothetical protein
MDILNVFRVTPGSYLVAMALTLLCVALLPSGLLHIRRPRQRKRKTFPLMELYVIRILSNM